MVIINEFPTLIPQKMHFNAHFPTEFIKLLNISQYIRAIPKTFILR